MSRLIHKSTSRPIADFLIKAQGLKQRIKGLIGHPGLKEREAFWISSCPSIHTFFMAFPIDVIFTDKNFRALSLFEKIRPGRIVFGSWGSQNAFEMKAGQIQASGLKKGDILYVEH